MPQIKTTKIAVRVYVKKGNLGDSFETIYDQMNADELAAVAAVADAEDQLGEKYGSAFWSLFDFGYYLHPVISVPSNAVFVNKNAKGLTPTVNLEATYGDGSAARYVIYPGLLDKFTGKSWSAAELLPYFNALLFKKTGEDGNQSILCKYIPSLCKLPAWAWLAVVAYGAKETLDAKPEMQIWYGAGTALALDSFGQAGGLSAVLPQKK